MTIQPEDQQTVLSALRLARTLLLGFIQDRGPSASDQALVREAKSRLSSTSRLLKKLQRQGLHARVKIE